MPFPATTTSCAASPVCGAPGSRAVAASTAAGLALGGMTAALGGGACQCAATGGAAGAPAAVAGTTPTAPATVATVAAVRGRRAGRVMAGSSTTYL
jgi:hypothetical protein